MSFAASFVEADPPRSSLPAIDRSMLMTVFGSSTGSAPMSTQESVRSRAAGTVRMRGGAFLVLFHSLKLESIVAPCVCNFCFNSSILILQSSGVLPPNPDFTNGDRAC